MLIHYPCPAQKHSCCYMILEPCDLTPPSSYYTEGTGAELSVGLLDVAGQQWVIAQFNHLFSDSSEHQHGQQGAAAWSCRCAQTADNVSQSFLFFVNWSIFTACSAVCVVSGLCWRSLYAPPTDGWNYHCQYSLFSTHSKGLPHNRGVIV